MALSSSILVAGLGERTCEFLIPTLLKEGYQTHVAVGLHPILERLHCAIDLVLLDLPSADEVASLPTVRAASSATMIVIGPGRNAHLVVRALDLGADDYVQRPFRTDELLARVRAQLRRRNSQGSILVFGKLSLDPQGRRATYGGRALDLGVEEFALLSLLAARPGHLYPSEFLARQVWGAARCSDCDLLASTVTRLRHLIEPDPEVPTILVGSRERGYWLGGLTRELNREP